MSHRSAEIKEKSARYSRWFRVYTEIIDDPKTAQLSDRHGWGWVRVLSIAKRSDDGVLPAIADIAFYLRCSRTDAENLISDLIELGLLDVISSGPSGSIIKPHNWDKRQFRWDGKDVTQADRKRRSRLKKRTGHGRVTVEVTEVASVSVSDSVEEDRDYSIQEEGKTLSVGEYTREVLS